jgi:hypothetical protein
MPNVLDTIKKISLRFYPKARAFKFPFGGITEQLHSALAQSEARAYNDALSILDSALPDNDNFTTDDATDWERRLGIFSSNAVPLSDRKLAIIRKINHPGIIKPRQNYRYIEEQLRAAGFDVHVYENKFSDGSGGFITKTPEQILGTSAGAAIHSPTVRHGTIQHGGTYSNKIANYIEQEKDATFVVYPNFRSTFFIAGASVSTFANVLAVRKSEFRQLILQLKPVETVGFLFINYI